jgi:hypothetical protein
MVTRELQQEVIGRHTHPVHGSPFWIDRLARLNLTAGDVLREPDAVSPLTADELRLWPVEAFLPADLRRHPPHLITADTSGFSGDPVTTVFLDDEFEAGFVTPFVAEADRSGFPVKCRWLWAGPSGPHAIGKAIRAILASVNGIDPFAVDFDPRWFRKLPRGSLSARRYLEHIYDQIRLILDRQPVDVLFTTPPVVALLAERLEDDLRNRIRGVHYGGMGMSCDEYRGFRDAFPEAVHMSGYGNSLFGMFPEISFSDRGIEFGTESKRVDVAVVTRDSGSLRRCAAGESGRVMLSRFDRSCLLLNMIQEDNAIRTQRGILNPHRDPRQFAGKLLY